MTDVDNGRDRARPPRPAPETPGHHPADPTADPTAEGIDRSSPDGPTERTRRPIVATHDVAPGLVDGERVAAVTPVVPEQASAEAREGIARRRLVAQTGRCPCGAVLRLPNRAQRRAARRARRPLHTAVRHASSCPARDEAIRAALQGAP